MNSFWGVPGVGSRAFQNASMKISLSRSFVRVRKTSSSLSRMILEVSLIQSCYFGGRSFGRIRPWPAAGGTATIKKQNGRRIQNATLVHLVADLSGLRMSFNFLLSVFNIWKKQKNF
jgi:hypothetical protein